MKNKKIYIYQLAPKMHTSFKLKVNNPPKGYEFVFPKNKVKAKLLAFCLNSKIIKFIYQNSIKKLFRSLKFYEATYATKKPKNVDLTFQGGYVFDMNSPFIVEILDNIYSLAGYDYGLFMKNKQDIERKLLSPYCKRIIIVNESSYEMMKQHFSKEVIKKCTLIRAAIPKQNFKKNYEKKTVQIIFIGSIVNQDDFLIKGGLEVLEVFSRISKEFKNVKLVILCKTPEYLKKKYSHIKNITFVKSNLSDEEMNKLFINSDICFNPGHHYSLMATLESMSYAIPMVALDTWGVRDYINDKCAIIVKPADLPGYNSPGFPANIRSKEFISQIRVPDKKVLERLYSAVRKLIIDKNLRERLGKRAKKVAEIKFSVQTMQRKLKKVFDDATE